MAGEEKKKEALFEMKQTERDTNLKRGKTRVKRRIQEEEPEIQIKKGTRVKGSVREKETEIKIKVTEKVTENERVIDDGDWQAQLQMLAGGGAGGRGPPPMVSRKKTFTQMVAPEPYLEESNNQTNQTVNSLW